MAVVVALQRVTPPLTPPRRTGEGDFGCGSSHLRETFQPDGACWVSPCQLERLIFEEILENDRRTTAATERETAHILMLT